MNDRSVLLLKFVQKYTSQLVINSFKRQCIACTRNISCRMIFSILIFVYWKTEFFTNNKCMLLRLPMKAYAFFLVKFDTRRVQPLVMSTRVQRCSELTFIDSIKRANWKKTRSTRFFLMHSSHSLDPKK